MYLCKCASLCLSVVDNTHQTIRLPPDSGLRGLLLTSTMESCIIFVFSLFPLLWAFPRKCHLSLTDKSMALKLTPNSKTLPHEVPRFPSWASLPECVTRAANPVRSVHAPIRVPTTCLPYLKEGPTSPAFRDYSPGVTYDALVLLYHH